MITHTNTHTSLTTLSHTHKQAHINPTHKTKIQTHTYTQREKQANEPAFVPYHNICDWATGRNGVEVVMENKKKTNGKIGINKVNNLLKIIASLMT